MRGRGVSAVLSAVNSHQSTYSSPPSPCRSPGYVGAPLFGVRSHPGVGTAHSGQLYAGHPVQSLLQGAGWVGEDCGVHWKQGEIHSLLLVGWHVLSLSTWLVYSYGMLLCSGTMTLLSIPAIFETVWAGPCVLVREVSLFHR